jgi:predicted transglutaminase-like cysteine proteinase
LCFCLSINSIDASDNLATGPLWIKTAVEVLMRITLAAAAIGVAAFAIPSERASSLAAQPRHALPSDGPNVFGSIGLPLGHTRYSDRWRRVASSNAPGSLQQLTQPARSLPGSAKARFVNAALNHTIRYRFDTNPSGDHWATPRETLDQRAGDCEDFVIAKMHALRDLGVPPSDLFMIIGHDATAGVAHAVLLVRAQGQFWVLDNRSDQLIPQQDYRQFYPIISFSAAGRSWLHRYPVGKTPPAVRAMSLAYAKGRATNLGNSDASRRPLRG